LTLLPDPNDPRLQSLRLSVLFASLPFGMLLFALPLIGRDMGASALEIGGLFSVFSLILVVVRPVVGRGLDHYGRRPFLIAGLLGYALANAVYGIASGVGGLYLARLAQGLGSGLMWLAAYAIVADLAPAEVRGGRYGQVEEMANRGAIIGSLVGFTVLGFIGRGDIGRGLESGWHALFVGYTAASLVAAAIAWRGVPETLHRSRERVSLAPASTEDAPDGIQGVWRLPGQLRILMGIVLLTASASALLSPILMIYLRDHFSANMFTLALAYLPAALAASVLPSRLGRLSDRFGRRPPLVIALLVGGLTSLAIPRLHSLWPLALLWVVEAAAFSAATPAEEALVVDVSGGERRGTAFGYYTAAAGLGGVIGPLIGGLLYDRFAAVWAFRANALLMLLGAALIVLLVREPLRPAAAEPK